MAYKICDWIDSILRLFMSQERFDKIARWTADKLRSMEETEALEHNKLLSTQEDTQLGVRWRSL